jgi:hypothetical protein
MLSLCRRVNTKVIWKTAPTLQTRTKFINYRKARLQREELLQKKVEATTKYNENIIKVHQIFTVDLIGENSEKLGTMSTQDAIATAKRLSLKKHRLCVVLVDVCFESFYYGNLYCLVMS